MTNYIDMEGPEFLDAVGVDATKWAEAFCQISPNCGIPEGAMVTWFSNAMMAMHDHLRPESAPVRLPDGSGFFIN